MTNIQLCRQLLCQLARQGVGEVVLCAGARNAPLVSVLAAAQGVQLFSFFEERSAGFFALGRALASRRPVAIVTTSGTAAAELLPATIEADHQGIPLVLVTADRPRRYRGSGAPQTIVQPGLFSHYVAETFDIEGSIDRLRLAAFRPVHVNVCMDEPLLDEAISPWLWPSPEDTFTQPLARCASSSLSIGVRRPLVILGSLTRAQAEPIASLVQRWSCPVYAEGTSQLRARFAPLPDLATLEMDSVIRIGGIPTVRFWRDLEFSQLPVWNFSDLPYSGLARASEVLPLSALPQQVNFEPWSAGAGEVEGCQEFPASEPGWIHWLSRQMRNADRTFLGNSLPIREWDLAATRDSSPEIFANRGVNGIDGLISTFLGLCEPSRTNWAVIGDLSALYDLSGPWALRARPCDSVNLVIINNGGGRIFKRMFRQPLFENEHELNFSDWARMWNLDYLCLENKPPESLAPSARPRVIEIRPDAVQTEAFWQAYERRKRK